MAKANKGGATAVEKPSDMDEAAQVGRKARSNPLLMSNT